MRQIWDDFLKKGGTLKKRSSNWAEYPAAICCFHLVTNKARTIDGTKKGEGKRWRSGTGLISSDFYFIFIQIVIGL